jgi:pre-mRNA-splicing factor 38A
VFNQWIAMDHKADARQALDERGYEGVLIRGDNPLKLLETAVRERIIQSYSWQ